MDQLFPAVLGLFLLYAVLHAVKKGSVGDDLGGVTNRNEQPFVFWLIISIIGLCSVFLIGVSIFGLMFL